MLKEETVFTTSDGETFPNDKEGAEKHEAFLEALKPAHEYEKVLKKAGWNEGPALSRQVNVVKDYLGYKETGNAPLPPEAKVKPPQTTETPLTKEEKKPKSKPDEKMGK